MRRRVRKKMENKKAKEFTQFEKETLRLMRIQTAIVILQVIFLLMGQRA